MKLLTLNTHSLLEENYRQKLTDFVRVVAREKPDVIALQEVNQQDGRAAADDELTVRPLCPPNTVLRADNHLLSAVKMLAESGIRYHSAWLPVKKGYGRFDEGLALMSLSPILETEELTVSRSDDYASWKTRKILGIRTQDAPEEWFFSVHYGFWEDPDEPFREQWEKTARHMAKYDAVWLMGDFNCPAEVRGEGYDLIASSGWQDSYTLAERRDSGITVNKAIDGWKDKCPSPRGMRIDQIWTNRPVRVRSSFVLFDGRKEPPVSDHCGVIIEYERSPLCP